MRQNHNILAMLFFACLAFVWAPSVDAAQVGVAWVGKSSMTLRVVKGFEKGMADLSPDIKLEYHRELESMDQLSSLAAKWEKEKDGMVLLRSNAAEWLAKNPPSIPTFIGGCNNPEELGAVKEMGKPDGQITGVTYYLSVSSQFEIFTAILPGMKSVLLLLEKNHPSSRIDQENTRKVTEKLGIAYNEKFCASAEDVVAAVNAYKDKVSAIIVGNEALTMDNTEAIVKAAGKTPVLSYSSKPVKSGALGGFAADDEKLGYMLAESVIEIIKKGKTVKEVPVKVDPKPVFFINTKTAQNIGIEIPYSILSCATIID